jgi:hypothetical protein
MRFHTYEKRRLIFGLILIVVGFLGSYLYVQANPFIYNAYVQGNDSLGTPVLQTFTSHSILSSPTSIMIFGLGIIGFLIIFSVFVKRMRNFFGTNHYY